MPTLEEIKVLPKEERKAILSALKDDKELVEEVVEPVVELVVEPIVEPVVKKTDDEVLKQNQLDEAKKLEAAILIEMENTDDREVAKKLAMDHMSEKADYYEKKPVVEEIVKKPEVEKNDFDARFKTLEKTFEEKTNKALEAYEERLNAKYKKLEEENIELKRTHPMGNFTSKPNDGTLKRAEARDKLSMDYKERNNQHSNV